MITIKNRASDSLIYEALREMCDQTLKVRYISRGCFSYRRCEYGGFGFEKTDQEGAEEKPVLYSDYLKTLCSAHHNVMPGTYEPLPHKISDWLLTGKSLCPVSYTHLTLPTNREV